MITEADVLRIRKSLKLSQSGFAKLLRVQSLTVSRWEGEEVRVTEPMALLIELAAKAKKRGEI